MYQHIQSSALPHLKHYHTARALHAEIKPWRGSADQNTRPLCRNRGRTKTIRLDGDDVVCTYHSTDVVRFRPNGEVVVTGYPSISTQLFAASILSSPDKTYDQSSPLFAMSGARPFKALVPSTQDQPWYQCPTLFFDDILTLKSNANGGWDVVSGTRSVDGYQLDRKATGPLLKAAGYTGFAAFYKVYTRLAQSDESSAQKRYHSRSWRWQQAMREPDADEALAMLSDQSRWKELADSFYLVEPTAFLRNAIYARAYREGKVFWKTVTYETGGSGYGGGRNVLSRDRPEALWT